MAPNGTIRFVLYVQKGQQMNVNLSTVSDSSATPCGSLYIVRADGVAFTFNPTMSWSYVLPASQNYYIEVFFMLQQSINYQLMVEIPADGVYAILVG